MGRTHQFAKSLSSGYLTTLANILYSFGTVPLALHYLTKAEFGLWALVTQLATYLNLVDLGMMASVARILIDHKDRREEGTYGAIIKTGAIVFSMQGLLVIIIGLSIAPFLSPLLNIPPDLQGSFAHLFKWQCLVLGIGFVTNVFGAILHSHQRNDVINHSQILYFVVGFLSMWGCFHSGFGLSSVIVAALLTRLAAAVLLVFSCWRCRLLPNAEQWGTASIKLFKYLFKFGGDVFIQNIGWQLLTASPVVIVTRFVGLEAAASWSICTKVFTVAQQIVFRICDFSVAALSEMFARGEMERLYRRFNELLIISGSFAILVCAIVASANQSFVHLWTAGRVSWGVTNDFLMAVLSSLYAFNRWHGQLAWASKQVHTMRYIYFFEGLCFVVVGIALAIPFKIAGVLSAAILCDIAFTGLYGLRNSARIMDSTVGRLLRTTVLVPVRFAAIAIPLAIMQIWLVPTGLSDQLRLSLILGGFAPVCLFLFWWVGLTRALRQELYKLLVKAATPLLKGLRLA